MATVDLYDVLDVEPECTQTELTHAYKKLVKKYHPDKNRGKHKDLFDLIVHAYGVLRDEKSRRDYDRLKKMSDKATKPHDAFQSEFDAFIELQEKGDTPEARRAAQIRFQEEFEEMNMRHKFDATKDKPLSKKDTDQMLEDLRLARDDDNIDLMPDPLFGEDGKGFDNAKFNEAFDLMYDSGMSMVETKGVPGAYTSIGGNLNDGEYVGVDMDYSKLYGENDDMMEFEGQDYANKDSGAQRLRKLTKDDLTSLKGADYVKGHSMRGDKDYASKLEDLVRARETEYRDDYEPDIEYDTKDTTFRFLQEFEGTSSTAALFDDENTMRDKYKKLLRKREKKDKKKIN